MEGTQKRDLSGTWTGRVEGNNPGNATLRISREGDCWVGTVTAMETSERGEHIALVRYGVEIRQTGDNAFHGEGVIIDKQPSEIQTGCLFVDFRLGGENEMIGEWGTGIGTTGTFKLRRTFQRKAA